LPTISSPRLTRWMRWPGCPPAGRQSNPGEPPPRRLCREEIRCLMPAHGRRVLPSVG
jgi:hypothetical protein